MAIEDYFNTPFYIYTRTQAKVDGRLVTSFVKSVEYLGAVFTPSTTKTVRVGIEDYVVIKTLYCDTSISVKNGDYIEVDNNSFDVGNILNTNNLNHHLQIQLISRIL